MGVVNTPLDKPPPYDQAMVGTGTPCIHKGETTCSTPHSFCCACRNGNPLTPIVRIVNPGEAPLPAWLPHDNPDLYCEECRSYWDTHFQVSRLPTFESTVNGHNSPPSPYVAIHFTAIQSVPNARERFSPPIGSRPAGPWTRRPRLQAPAAAPESHAVVPTQTGAGGTAASASNTAQPPPGPAAPIPLFVPSPYAMPPDVAARFAADMIIRVAHDAAAAVQEEQQAAAAPNMACERCGRRSKQAMNHPCMHVTMCVPCSRWHYPRGSHDEVPADPAAACTRCDEIVSHIVCILSTPLPTC
jgi:hypothetical protein